MNILRSRLDPAWIRSTLNPWVMMTSMSCSKVMLSTLPPEPVIASKKPYKVELVGGKRYSWCTCGHSKKQPFCDGSHKTKAQGLGPHRFVPEKDSTVWLCGCKYTNNPPFCDGTHKSEFIQCSPLAEESDVKS
ncbi:CDGSH iron-sulfur domain-containing protein 3, mitochondrial-like [Gadus chalcogrammus]|uniref:CDGSH iron-sulfur domain-containing protein 3, mitochondrial-like n=1 Tax=Gadus chalcogrammus TaxID=1042646 RepID=UPI0024C3E8A4|nr:CDGSH iron-sulfur domain-containing protein 3, mitochondrial-like [Gadus chalcogrammus]